MAGSMSNLVLDRSQTIALIGAYGARRHLWDAGDPRYFSRALRERAWRQIAHGLALPHRPPITALKKKLESLLGSYRREKSREKQSIMSGLGPDEAYKSKWYAYEHFHFMSEKTCPGAPVQPQHSANITHESPSLHKLELIKVELNMCEGDEYISDKHDLGSDEEPPSAELLPVSKRAKRKRTAAGRRRRRPLSTALDDDNLTEGLDEETDTPQHSSEPFYDDPYDTFGLYVASELRKYDELTLAHVKHAISNIIFDADMGKFQQLPAVACAYIPNGSASSPPGRSDHVIQNQ